MLAVLTVDGGSDSNKRDGRLQLIILESKRFRRIGGRAGRQEGDEDDAGKSLAIVRGLVAAEMTKKITKQLDVINRSCH